MKQFLFPVIGLGIVGGLLAGAHVYAPAVQARAKIETSQAEAVPIQRVGLTRGGEAPQGTEKPTVPEQKQIPVPLVVRSRPAAWEPPPGYDATQVDQATLPSQPAAIEQDNALARRAVEEDGYKSIRDIKPGPDGTWRVRAMRGRTEVLLVVDKDGRVSAQ